MKNIAVLATLLSAATSGLAKRIKSPECTCCQALANVENLKGKVYDPEDKRYSARLDSYYSANSALAPWCMVLPENAEDVASIVNVFNEYQCPFGMRSGAHAAWKGSNAIKDGVTVDFAKGYLNATTYDEETKVASVGPGSDWGHSYETLDQFGVANVGGRASIVGVGGFTTGGGYSFFSQKRGFACDAVSNFEVVLSDGSIVNANKDENPDLWKGLKGGSGNLGFVTRIDQPVEDSNTIWGGFTFFDLEKRDEVFKTARQFFVDMEDDHASQLICTLQYSKGEIGIITVMSNVDSVGDAKIFEPFSKIEHKDTTVDVGNLYEIVEQFTGPTPLGVYPNWASGLITNDQHQMEFMADKLAEYTPLMEQAAPGSDFEVILQFQPVTPNMVKVGKENGGNVMGLESRITDEPAIMWMILVTVDTAENQELIDPIAKKFRQECEQKARETGVDLDWNFVNYALGDQDPIKAYGPDVVEFMQKTSAEYDAVGMFQKLRKTGFHIPKEE